MKETIEKLSKQTVLGKEVMMYGRLENPLFMAKDVAEWIDHKDVSMMLKSVDEDEKLIQTLFVSGQNRDCWFLTENGLYEVLMLSRKPIAKQFKKEIKRILHELRVNGTVMSARMAMASPEEQAVSFQRALDNAVQHAMEIAENWFAPKIEKAEAERDEAIRTKAWIADKQTATALNTASQLRKANKNLLDYKQLYLELKAKKDSEFKNRSDGQKRRHGTLPPINPNPMKQMNLPFKKEN